MRLISLTGLASLATGVTAIAISSHHTHYSAGNTTVSRPHDTAKHNSSATPTETAAGVCVSVMLDRSSPWAEPSALTAPCGQFTTLCEDEKYIRLPLGAKMAARAEKTPPSPPLRPTSNLESTITRKAVAPRAPLRPTYNSIVTVTSTAPAKRIDEKAAWYLECTGDGKAWAYGNVCTDHDFILPVDKQECDQWCSCDKNGKMHCASPVQGCEDKGQVTVMCNKGSTAFSCQCRKLGTEQKDQNTVTKRAEAAGAMTTMYGVHFDPLVVGAIYVPQSWAAEGSEAFHDNSYSLITPTTEIVGTAWPGPNPTGPTTQDQPFPPDQTTTVYGLAYVSAWSKYEMPAWVVAKKDKFLAEDLWSQFMISSMEVNTAYSTNAVKALLANAIMTKRTAVEESTYTTLTSNTDATTSSNQPGPSTTMYGVGYEGDPSDSHLAVSAVIVASTETSNVLSAFSQASMSQITPSTLLSQSIPTSVANKADAQPTTIYGLAYDNGSSELVMPAAIVPHSRVSFVQSAYSSFNVTQIEPHTSGIYHATSPSADNTGPVYTTVYLATVTVTATAPAQHGNERFVVVESQHPDHVHSHNVTLPYPHLSFPHATLPTTLSTMTMSKDSNSLETRDMHLQCDGNLNDNYLAKICENTEIWLSGNYCKAHCGCTEAGVVTCDTHHEPEFIDDCGGTNLANGFCSNAHASMRCYCTG